MHSQEKETTVDSSAENAPASPKKPAEKASNAEEISRVARDMFSRMCQGLERDVITEDGVERAIQNLAESSMNPTRSLFGTEGFERLSEGMKSTIRKLLMDCLCSSPNKEVCPFLPYPLCAIEKGVHSCSILGMYVLTGQIS